MSILAESLPQSPAPTLPVVPLLREMPSLLEYRSEADPDAEFIPKTVAGFALGALTMGVGLDFAETLLTHSGASISQLLPGMVMRFAFMLGIAGVSTSLLLVALPSAWSVSGRDTQVDQKRILPESAPSPY